MSNPLAPFEVNGKDFSDCVKQGGFRWKKYDLESDKAGRSLDTIMRRLIIGKKRQLTISCRRMTDARGRQLAAELDRPTVTIRYPDLRLGIVTKQFYGTEIEGGVWAAMNGVLYWENVNFVVTEV